MKWVVGMASAVAVYAFALIIWLLVPGTGPVFTVLWLVPFIAVFPLAAAGLALQSQAPLQRPGRVVAIAGSAIGAVLLAALIATVALPQPPHPGPGRVKDVGAGQYVRYYQGTTTPLTGDQNVAMAKSGQRGFLWTAGLLCLASIVVAGVRGEQQAYRAARRPKPARPKVPEIRLRRR